MVKKQELMVGDILLFKDGNDFITKAIKYFTHSPYNHVGVYLGDGIVAEALAEGFTTTLHDEYYLMNEDKVHVYRLRKGEINGEQLLKDVEELRGRPYGFLDILEIAVYILTKKNIFVERSEALICSEATAELYVRQNKILVEDKPFDRISPYDISQSKILKYVIFNNEE